MSSQSLKQTLRQQITEHQQQLSSDYLQQSNQAIIQQLLKLDEIQQAKTIFCYISIDQEIDTKLLIKHWLAQGKMVAVPRCHDSRNMDAYQILSLDDLVIGKYGIPTAKADCRLVEPSEVEVGIIPCVTGDLVGNRLGHGNGFYDIYFSRSHLIKIMPCRQTLLVDKIPMQEWDKPIDILVTEDNIYRFNNKI